MNTELFVLLLIFNCCLAAVQRNEQCQPRSGDELIWEYDVRRPYRTGVYQEVEAEYGPTSATISCVGINSLSDEDNGAVWITSGGIGHSFVKIKFRSKYSKGLRYRVYVYGQPMLRTG